MLHTLLNPFRPIYPHIGSYITLYEVQKYSATRGSCAEGESLIQRMGATHKEITKSLVCAQAYQACKYNKSYRNMEYKVSQKFGSGLKTTQSSKRHKSWIGKYTASITSWKE